MIDIEFKKVTEAHIRHVADNMRKSDIIEVVAAGSKSPYEALKTSVDKTKASVSACYKGEPLVIFGMDKPNPTTGTAIIWMLGTNESLKYRREFMYYTRLMLEEMLYEATSLTNYVHDRNKVSIKWLKALGFTVDKPMVAGPYNELFRKFTMERK